jgi:outer membrane protein assembly factor BamB
MYDDEFYQSRFSVSSKPMLSNETIYFGTSDNYLFALDNAAGEEKWKSKFLGYISTPTVSMGMVYIGSDDKHLYGLDIKTGKEKLKFETGGIVSTPAVSKRVVYFGSDHHLYALQIPE